MIIIYIASLEYLEILFFVLEEFLSRYVYIYIYTKLKLIRGLTSFNFFR